MMRAMYSAVSGIKAQQTSLDVISNNIANVDTTGYKSQRVSFSDLLSQTLSSASGSTSTSGGTNPVQVGLGTSVASTDTIMTVGSTQSTGVATDLSISGNGFFIVSGGSQSQYQFTRDGDLSYDVDGNLTVNGYKVCGWESYTTDSNGNKVYNTNGSVEPINLYSDSYSGNKKLMAAKATTKETLSGNLKTSATVKGTALNDIGTISQTATIATNSTGISSLSSTTGLTQGKTYTLALANPSQTVAIGSTNTTGITSISAPSGLTTSSTYTIKLTADGSNFDITWTDASGNTVASKTNVDLSSGSTTLNGSNGETITIPAGTVTAGTMTFTATNTFDVTVKDANNTAIITKSGVDLSSATTLTGTNGETITLPASTSATAGTMTFTAANNKDQTATMTVYDAQGNSYDVSVNFTKSYYDSSTGQTSWYWETSSGDSNVASVTGSGYLLFDSSGNLVTTDNSYPSTASVTVSPGGSSPVTLSLDFSKVASMVLSSGDSSVTSSQDGYAAGTLSGLSIGSDGTITGSYSNGQTQSLAQIALANFTNPEGLEKVGDNLYVTTVNSGAFTGGVVAGSNGTGSLSSGTLEMSNVDLAEQFSDMMISQRAYQANSKVITAADQCLQSLINMVS
ncbi:flagellar hook-basal body complex protein [Propionispora hippei]|uniref:Flagellar hook protein FlgE n=1 Tax=Propionispora hippei DSM 15287 TaxID=1123003 RepID=A0A1M6C1W2_9FIRM|nr:flagellar hook-basal body complex protein [Propionispora hippei]SHI54698.1 flagellar hook protein FlgE [Propionispora hippei DSM 15287]